VSDALRGAEAWLAASAGPGPPPGWRADVAAALAEALRDWQPGPRPRRLVGRAAAAPPCHLAGLSAALLGTGDSSRERARYHARWLLHLLHPDDPARAPRVSVVIPVRDDAGELRQSVASALAQRLPPLEVIVVDDGSREPVGEALERLATPGGPELRVLSQPPSGPAAARNRGIAAARGDLVQLLDADDPLEPDALAAKLEALHHVGDAELVCCGFHLVGDPELHAADGSRFGDAHCPTRDLLACWVRRYPFHVSSVLAARWSLLEAGPFDTALDSAEDDELFLRLALRGTRVTAVDRPLYARHLRPGSVTHVSEKVWIRSLAVRVRGLVALLDEPARWPYLGALARRAGHAFHARRLFADVAAAPLDAEREALLARVRTLPEHAAARRASARLPLAVLADELFRECREGAFHARLDAALAEARARSPEPGQDDLAIWLKRDGEPRMTRGNAAALDLLRDVARPRPRFWRWLPAPWSVRRGA
jgi:glycosyltransferase involved in cell wall biosynthesis